MSYQLIADSGSTKTDWVLVHQGQSIKELTTQGLNPYIMSFDEMVWVVQQYVWPYFQCPEMAVETMQIYFYGAGCGAEEKQKSVKEVLQLVIPTAVVEVKDDMMGAARAVWGREMGIACILGTGSNSCCYDGVQIVANRPAPGYILGDEGGGAHLGKILLVDFINDEMPIGLKELMQREFSLTNEVIYENVYKRKLPNRYLASFAVFIKQELSGEFKTYLEKIVMTNFQIYFDKHIKKYDSKWGNKLHTIGSVGYHFSEQFSLVARINGYNLNQTLKSPIKGLVKYHSIDINKYG